MDNDLMFHRNTVDTPAELPAAEAAVLAAPARNCTKHFWRAKMLLITGPSPPHPASRIMALGGMCDVFFGE